MTFYAQACRDTAFNLISTARVHRAIGQHNEAARLVNIARWYWRKFKDTWA